MKTKWRKDVMPWAVTSVIMFMFNIWMWAYIVEEREMLYNQWESHWGTTAHAKQEHRLDTMLILYEKKVLHPYREQLGAAARALTKAHQRIESLEWVLLTPEADQEAQLYQHLHSPHAPLPTVTP